jgi:glycosyltransferase involved in cell wall biosynthesis
MAKVSILMPACNVEAFLRECMDSVINQTLRDIEIICVDDGSKDSTGDILDEYAKKDERVKVIHKVNTGYGNSMNVGLDTATGEYIGIIETDDFAELDMFEKLYDVAKKNNADVVKSNYFTYVSKPEPKSTVLEVLKEFENYDKVFKPLDFQQIYKVRPCIWTGLYRREMLVENKVRFNETPGASYQDTGFAFKVWTSAERAVLVKDAYLHYRIDNANSSVKSTSKIFCLCDEYESMDDFLKIHPEKLEKVRNIKAYLKYESYRWNYDRLSLEFKYHFLMRMKSELMLEREEGNLDESYFKEFQWKRLNRILDDTDSFFSESCKKELGGVKTVQDLIEDHKRIKAKLKKTQGDVKKITGEKRQLEAKLKKAEDRCAELENSTSYKVGRKLTYIPGKIKRKISR